MDSSEKWAIGIASAGALAAIGIAYAGAKRDRELILRQQQQQQQQQAQNVLTTPIPFPALPSPAPVPTTLATPTTPATPATPATPVPPDAVPTWVSTPTAPVVNTAIVDGTVVEAAQQALNNIATSQQWPQVSVNGNANDPTFVTELGEFQSYANSTYASQLGGTLLPTTGILDAPTLAALFLVSGLQGASATTPAPPPLPASPPSGTALVTDPALIQTAQVLTNTFLQAGQLSPPATPTDGNASNPTFVTALAAVQTWLNAQMASTTQAPANYQSLTGTAWTPLRTDGALDGATYQALVLFAEES